MNSIECVQRWSANVRRLGLKLSSAQVLVALAKGLVQHREIVCDSGLCPGTVTNILAGFVAQGVVRFVSSDRPRCYFLTERGVREVRMLMDMKTEVPHGF